MSSFLSPEMNSSTRTLTGIVISVPILEHNDDIDQSVPRKFVCPPREAARRRKSINTSCVTLKTETSSFAEADADEHCSVKSDHHERNRNSKLSTSLHVPKETSKTSPKAGKQKHSASYENLPPPPTFSWRRTLFGNAKKHRKKAKNERKTETTETVNDHYDVKGVLERTTIVTTKRRNGTVATWQHKEYISPSNPKYPRSNRRYGPSEGTNKPSRGSTNTNVPNVAMRRNKNKQKFQQNAPHEKK
mmetsp:Transcript_23118/g.54589  ORF Transcript_23118/g.54589 Transcript_23118/m.54589 type:complete len:246 (+) Transcript_23118:85-822(+)